MILMLIKADLKSSFFVRFILNSDVIRAVKDICKGII